MAWGDIHLKNETFKELKVRSNNFTNDVPIYNKKLMQHIEDLYVKLYDSGKINTALNWVTPMHQLQTLLYWSKKGAIDIKKLMKEGEMKMKMKDILKEDGSVNLNGEILDAIQNMHALFNKIKNNGAIPRGYTRRLYTDFAALYKTLNTISDLLMKKEK